MIAGLNAATCTASSPNITEMPPQLPPSELHQVIWSAGITVQKRLSGSSPISLYSRGTCTYTCSFVDVRLKCPTANLLSISPIYPTIIIIVFVGCTQFSAMVGVPVFLFIFHQTGMAVLWECENAKKRTTILSHVKGVMQTSCMTPCS